VHMTNLQARMAMNSRQEPLELKIMLATITDKSSTSELKIMTTYFAGHSFS